MLSGWAKKGRPFRKSEWKISHIKKHFGGTYSEYLSDVNTSIRGKRKRDKMFRKVYGFK
jgi:hypothetical protein